MQTDSIYLNATNDYGTSAGRTAAYSAQPIDISGYNKVTIVLCGIAAADGYNRFACDDTNCIAAVFSTSPIANTTFPSNAYAYKDLNNGSWDFGTVRTVAWNISGLTGTYYFSLIARAYQTYSYANWLRVYSVIFE